MRRRGKGRKEGERGGSRRTGTCQEVDTSEMQCVAGSGPFNRHANHCGCAKETGRLSLLLFRVASQNGMQHQESTRQQHVGEEIIRGRASVKERVCLLSSSSSSLHPGPFRKIRQRQGRRCIEYFGTDDGADGHRCCRAGSRKQRQSPTRTRIGRNRSLTHRRSIRRHKARLNAS